eukprot:MONOS_6951.1-p1 / transcript=MONOS_6951.1 / gene=MONOS_6951 / organism=Monocercomonoides_exilis_PA203 / gene_product=unspecified product / transcript_product=unspecified product / location=Mono_scaffold00228:69963-74680(+) / protein_length=1156 / sequence_SO=supercontig / SO=protein_coding / is_pseudo=false
MSRVGKVTIGLDDCNFSGEQAGMIEMVSKSALTNFTFALPKSIGLKEALIVCMSSSLSVKGCEIAIKQQSTNISFLSARGGRISDCTANVNVSNCTFKGVTCSLGKGGAISMHKPEVASPCHECLEKCTFEECKIKSDEACGGGVCCCIGMSNHLEITNCAFTGCEASVEKKGGFGGGLFLEFDHQDVEFVVSEPSFSQSSPNAAKCGSELFMKSPSLEASATDSTLPFAKTMADISLDSMRGFDGNDSEHAIPLILLFQAIGSEILASSLEGADTIACGFECYPCASIDQALSRFKTVDKRAITVRTESFVIHEIDLSDVKMISDGEQQASLTMPSAIESGTTMISSKGITQLEQLKIIVPPHISNEVKFVISSSTNKGVLSLTNCQIEIEDESEAPNNYVIIKISGSSIHLVFVTVTNCRMAMPLFSFDIVPPMNAPETAEVQMKNCSFSNITHQDKDSSALSCASLGCGSENRTEGKGGWLFFDCKQNYGFVFGNLSFNECSAFVGNNIYLKGDALSINLGKQQFALNMPTERERRNDFCGYGNDEAKEIPLALFEAEWNTPAFVNGVGGVDYPLCGFDWYPCSTITYAGNNRFNEEKAEIRLQSSFSFSKSVIFSGKAYEIDAENKGEKVEVEGIEENLKDVDMEMKVAGLQCKYSLIVATDSTIGIDGFGAMRVVLEADGELEITDCNMEECQAENRTEGKGGWLFFDCKQNYGFVFGNLSFNECCAFVGNNIYLKGNALSINLGKQQFALNMPTERERRNDFCGYGNDEAKEIPLALFEAEWNTPAFVNGVGGVDYPLCGFDWYPCSTITYAGNNRFIEENAAIRLQSSFSFSKSVIFSGKAYEIDAESKGEKVEVEGIEENLKDVDMEMKVAGLQCKYSLIVATDSTIGIDGFVFQNLSSANSTYSNHCTILVEEACGLTLLECNMSGLKRTTDSGCSVVGVVGNENIIQINGCFFDDIVCSSSGSQGGSLHVKVLSGGELLFDNNSVCRSKVPAIDGDGGGLHITFESVEVAYSMKNVVFEGNDALWGKDIFLNCTKPSTIVDPLLWAGTAERGEEERNKWVFDFTDARINMTLLRFLFPTDDDIIYVDESLGNEMGSCGSGVNPCKELGFGYGKLGTSKTILHIQNSAWLLGEIDRKEEKADNPRR